jgi:hypothetical protein
VAIRKPTSFALIAILYVAGRAVFGHALAAAAQPTITLSPTCGAAQTSVQVTGSGWTAGTVDWDVTIKFDGATAATVKGSDVKQPGGTFTAKLIVPATAAPRGLPHSVTASQLAGEFGTNDASAPFMVPCPSLRLNVTCASVGDTISIHGAGFVEDHNINIAVVPPAEGKPDAVVLANRQSAFDVTIRVPSRPPGNYAVTASEVFTTTGAVVTFGPFIARASLQIPCTKASIKLVPQVGLPGTVVTVTGTGFPVGAIVKLSWNRGVPLRLASITIGPSQGFQIKVLVFPHDELGKRKLSAGPDLSVANVIVFNIATADFLAVPGSGQPRDFTWRR